MEAHEIDKSDRLPWTGGGKMKRQISITLILAFLIVAVFSGSTEGQMLIGHPIFENPEVWKLSASVTEDLYGTYMFRWPIKSALSYIIQNDQVYSLMCFTPDFVWDRIIDRDDIVGVFRSYGEHGYEPGPYFMSPTGIDVFTIQSNTAWHDCFFLFIPEWGASRIKRLCYYWQTQQYEDLGPIIGHGLHKPIDIDINNNCSFSDPYRSRLIWVLNSDDRLLLFDFDGNFIRDYGSTGSGEDQFMNPSALVCGKYLELADPECEPFSNTWYLYIADAGNDRWVAADAWPGNPPFFMDEYHNLAICGQIRDLETDPVGNVWAVLAGDKIAKFTMYLEFIGFFGTSGYGVNQFNEPWSISNAGGFLGSGDMAITEDWTDSSGIQRYFIGTDITDLCVSMYQGSEQCICAFQFMHVDYGKVTIRVYDESSNLIRTICSSEPMVSGTQVEYWDGNDLQGDPVPNGNYRVEVVDTAAYFSAETGEPVNTVTRNIWFYFCDLDFCDSGEGADYGPGECNRSGAIDIDDVVCVINVIFGGGPTWCFPYSGDADGNGFVDVDDVVYLINYIYGGGPPPPTCQEWVNSNGVPACAK